MTDERRWHNVVAENARLKETHRCAQLVVTAFRLRHEEALIDALRAFVREVCRQEERRWAEEPVYNDGCSDAAKEPKP